jgi:hypothetical protein
MAASLFGYMILVPGFFASVQTKILGAGGGFTLLTIAAVYGWWPVPIAAAATGIRGAYLALFVLDLAWAVLAQGIAGFAYCAIPVCSEFAPWGDVARYGSLIAGIAAAWTAWRAYRRASGPTQRMPVISAVILTVQSFAFQTANSRNF